MAVTALHQTTVTTDQLLALYAGDDLTLGHPTLELACLLCERLRPVSLGRFRLSVLGDTAPDRVPAGAFDLLELGFECWHRAGRPSR